MSVFKNLGKALLVAGFFMMFAAPVMAGQGLHPYTGNPCICMQDDDPSDTCLEACSE